MSFSTPSIDHNEVEKFSKLADEWWDEGGKFKPLHQFNPVRIGYIRGKIIRHFSISSSPKPLNGLKILDVGCGGGLLTVPLGKLGADILGIDVAENNIKVANSHKHKTNLGDNINFQYISVEDLEEQGHQFDVVLAMEVVEHVADIKAFLKSCMNLLKPNGLIFIATLNRTIKSYLLAIIGAEYVLRWLPKGTHSWDKFLEPAEIRVILDKYNSKIVDLTGVSYNPLLGSWSLTQDTSVNYIICASKEDEKA